MRIYLSPPDVGDAELRFVQEAFESNWIAPVGPQVDAFESELLASCGVKHAIALNSGTAALHLALELAGVGPSDEVFCSTLTFVASANPIRYVGASPVFVDCSAATWTLDPDLLEDELDRRGKVGQLPAAVIAVDVYGQCADYERIQHACAKHDVALIEDAAQALGSTAFGKAAGSFGSWGILSFNGNKIITTSGGGALLSNDQQSIERARYLAAQAREPAAHHEHIEVGYNYRLSNVLAALGRGQLESLDAKVKARRQIFNQYVDQLGGLPGLDFMPEAPYGSSNRWLTTLTIDVASFGSTREDVRRALERENIESRPVWKPMHLQPLYSQTPCLGGEVAADLFDRGLCLPSGSGLTSEQLSRIVAVIVDQHRA